MDTEVVDLDFDLDLDAVPGGDLTFAPPVAAAWAWRAALVPVAGPTGPLRSGR